MVVLKVKTSEGEVFRFRLERCDLPEIEQHLRTVCEGCSAAKHPVLIAKDQTIGPLTEQSLQASLAEDGIIRIEIRDEPAETAQTTVEVATEGNETLPNAESETIETMETMETLPSAPPLTGVWHPVEGQVLDPPPVPQVPQQVPQVPQAVPLQGHVMPQATQAAPDMPQMPQMPQQPWLDQLHETPNLLGQLISQSLQHANQHLHQNIHQHLHRTREHLQRHMNQLHQDCQTRQREWHQEMHRRCAEMHQRAHCHAHANHQRAQNTRNPQREDHTHWANTMNVQTEVQPMYVHPLEMTQQRRHLARGMITGCVRLHDSDLVLEDCMVTGAIHLTGSSRVLLRRGMLTGSVIRNASSTFENDGGMVTGQVVASGMP